MNYNKIHDRLKLPYFVLLIFLTFFGFFLIYLGKSRLGVIVFFIPALLLLSLYFEKYFKQILIISLFFGGYYQVSLRLQICLIVALIIIFWFLTTSQRKVFNDLSLPPAVKKSAFLIITAIYLSSVATPFISFTSIYFATLFFIFIFCSYVIFRSVKNIEDIDNLLYLFVIMTFISGVIIIIEIFMTGKLRSTGFAQFAIIDMSVIALITILFRDFLLSKPSKKSFFFTAVIFIILITTQSRFAWLGFLLTLLYGIFISYIYSKGSREILKSRLPIFVFISLIGIALFFVLGLQNIFFSRISNIDFSLFQNTDESELIANSLESRVLIWIVAVNAFLHNPITGVGYLMFSEVSTNYNILPELLYNVYVSGLDAHMTYLNFLCETGVIGLTSFIIYLLVMFKLSLKSIRLSQNHEDLKVSIVLNILVFFVMVHSIYSGAFTIGQNSLQMHIILGLVVVNYVLLKNKYAILIK